MKRLYNSNNETPRFGLVYDRIILWDYGWLENIHQDGIKYWYGGSNKYGIIKTYFI